ncbi:MAG: efflux RND transporter periplasmic adaptor subunit [Sedimentisphaerales bacterium]|nr:efflux RND transporter periplasmic adaptor subunit [Sedimentisphaerales bacterium]
MRGIQSTGLRIALFILVFALCSAMPLPAQNELLFGGENYSSLDAQRVVVLSMAVDGIISRLAHEPQDFVKKGDLLVKLDSNRMELEVKSFRAQLGLNHTVDLPQARIRFKYACDNLEIVEELYNTRIGDARAASEKERKEAVQSRDIAELELERIRMQGQMLELKLRQSQELLDRHSLRAPMDGVVVPFSSIKNLESRNLKRLQVGETVQAYAPAMAMMKVDKLQVRRTFPTERLADVRLGRTVDICVDREDSKLVPAEIVYISPTISYSTQRFEIKVELENPFVENPQQLPPGAYPYRFRPGMRAWVKLTPGK